MKSGLLILLTIIQANVFLAICDEGNKHLAGKSSREEKYGLIAANNRYIQYTGRIDFSDPAKPRFYSPGVYIKAKYSGRYCTVLLNDQVLYGTSNNYIEIILDDTIHYRVPTKGVTNKIVTGENLSRGKHTILICKDTEAGQGYLEFVGLQCRKLYPLPPKPERRIEFIGNSITCGSGIDVDEIPCGTGTWYDQHNAWMSYGPVTARNLNAQWHLTSVSGIGLIHSCCNMTTTMPLVFDKMDLNTNTGAWDFDNYQPDIVTVCLGQNDGLQDSAAFCNAYVDFLKTIRHHYPHTYIICLSSPMGDATLTSYLKKCLTAVVTKVNNEGDMKVLTYFFSKSYNSGCGTHPGLEEHQVIASELSAFLKTTMGW